MKVNEKKGFSEENVKGDYKPMRKSEGEGKELTQETSKGDGMSKGSKSEGAGGKDGGNFELGKRGGKEYHVEEAQTDGMSK